MEGLEGIATWKFNNVISNMKQFPNNWIQLGCELRWRSTHTGDSAR
jgi:hypothetical protein